jgi:hypothetical protein
MKSANHTCSEPGKKIRRKDAFTHNMRRGLAFFIPFILLIVVAVVLYSFKSHQTVQPTVVPVNYYVDSKNGNDKNKGTSKKSPWKSLDRLSRAPLRPGDSVCFKRGSRFTGPFTVNQAGAPGQYITITDYGSKNDPAPAFTNPVFEEGNYGNGIRINKSYVIVENLYFHQTAVHKPIPYKGEGWDVWEMGAIHIAREAEHCIVRDNEIEDCVAGIRSNGAYAIIERNYIHDCNKILKEWNWGPIGIWLGADHQEVRYNRIINYSAVDSRINWGPDAYGSGADGSAFEIDDARYDKSDISIHHNFTSNCQGFLEVTWTDVKQKPAYKSFRIHHNVSDDYQQFVALWRGEACHIENNTIIRRKVNANEWGVFNITQPNSRNVIRNNIIVTEKNVVVFNLGRKGTAKPNNIISHNLYFAKSGTLNIGREGPGEGALFGDPLFKNYDEGIEAQDFSISIHSPAVDKGLSLGYATDFVNTKIPQNERPDLGAFEFANEMKDDTAKENKSTIKNH